MGKTKQKSHAAKKVAVFFIVFIIIEMLIVGAFAYVFRNDDVTPSFGGYSLFLMDSDNMSKTAGIPKDALFIIEHGSPSKDKVGKPVLCENVPNIGSTVAALDDVASKGETIDGVVYIVSQDDGKKYEMKSSDIIGVASSYYKTAGKVIRFISKPVGIAACAAAPIILWVLIEIIILIVKISKTRKDDDAGYAEVDDDDEPVSIDDILFDKDDASPIELEQDEDAEDTVDDIKFDTPVSNYASENVEETVEEAEEASEEAVEEAVPVRHADVKETVSTTRKAASDSLEELMKMMEEEQKKLKDQLNSK